MNKQIEILSNVEGFDWDEWNIEKNWLKHRVTHVECETVFFNAPLIVRKDEPHSVLENRYFALGRTDNRRLLFVVFTIRRNKIRIISARDMSKKEKKAYEQIEKDTKI
ncbi:MAG: BrnT family toxin [Nitrospirota bacterium]|jgi:uncharacterized DUF497 family protein